MKNVFFSTALRKAASMAGKPGRLMVLISRMALKIREVNWKNVDTANIKQRFFVLGRIIKAYALGHYREIPWKSLLIVIAAVIYFVNPIDLLPDLLPIVGLTDDFGILVWVYNTVNNEIDRFLLWEQSQVTS
jgi:uncharacterized membrane protein YkvA (DUF1232 family)